MRKLLHTDVRSSQMRKCFQSCSSQLCSCASRSVTQKANVSHTMYPKQSRITCVSYFYETEQYLQFCATFFNMSRGLHDVVSITDLISFIQNQLSHSRMVLSPSHHGHMCIMRAVSLPDQTSDPGRPSDSDKKYLPDQTQNSSLSHNGVGALSTRPWIRPCAHNLRNVVVSLISDRRLQAKQTVVGFVADLCQRPHRSTKLFQDGTHQ